MCENEHDYTPTIMVDDAFIEEADSTKFLGVLLDKGLITSIQYARRLQKVYVLRNLAEFCSLDVLKMAYFGQHPHLSYGIHLWGGCSNNNFEKVKSQKKALRIISKLNYREFCRNAFRELGLLTLPCLYVLEVVLYCRFKCDLVQGSDVHNYETRGRANYRAERNRTAAHEHLPSSVGVN